jgi:hypothetical protein
MGTGRRPMLLLYIGLPLVALFFIVVSSLAPKSYPDFSTYNADKGGTKAFYLLLERLKYPVSRFNQITPEHGRGLMVMIEAEVISKKEADQLVAWVKRGNNLFIINSKADELSKSLKLSWTDSDGKKDEDETEEGKPKTKNLRVKADEKYFRDVNSLMLTEGNRLEPKAPDVEASYEDEFGTYLMVLKKGQGRILYLADSAMVTNSQIKGQDNGVFLINIINDNLMRNNQSQLWFNEWVHGYTPNTELREILTWPIRLVVIQLLIGVIILFHYWGRRFSKPVPIPRESPGITGDIVSSLANIYRQGRARNIILTNIYYNFRSGLTHYLGVPAQTANKRIISIFAQRPHIDVTTLEKLIIQIENELKVKKVNESELLSLVRQMEVWRQDNLTSLQERRKINDRK